jgi:hypothetical protein
MLPSEAQTDVRRFRRPSRFSIVEQDTSGRHDGSMRFLPSNSVCVATARAPAGDAEIDTIFGAKFISVFGSRGARGGES